MDRKEERKGRRCERERNKLSPHSIKWCSNNRRGDAVGAYMEGETRHSYQTERQTDRQTDRQTRKRGTRGRGRGKSILSS